MMLTQNTKMRKSSNSTHTVVNFSIPAFMSKSGFRTCPNAGLCTIGCYARQGAYIWTPVRRKHEANLAATQSQEFTDLMILEIKQWLKRKLVKTLVVRIHDSGDFYSEEYLNKWLEIMTHFRDDNVRFYAYTKQVKMFTGRVTPDNFRVIFSFGGRQDSLIRDTSYHARVFKTHKELRNARYLNASSDDMVAAFGNSTRIGLVYHGNKSFKNTKWNEV